MNYVPAVVREFRSIGGVVGEHHDVWRVEDRHLALVLSREEQSVLDRFDRPVGDEVF